MRLSGTHTAAQLGRNSELFFHAKSPSELQPIPAPVKVIEVLTM